MNNTSSLLRMVAAGHINEDAALTEIAQVESIQNFFGFSFRPALTWESGNPLAVLDGPISPDLSGDVLDWLASTADADNRVLRLNSGGGAAVTGVSIYNALRAEENVDVEVTGTAYSAASVILQGGRQRHAMPGSNVGIHRAMTFSFGNADVLLGVADQLMSMDKAIMEIYRIRSTASAVALKEAINKDTMLTGDEAYNMGLVDHYGEGQELPSADMDLPNSAKKDADDDAERPDSDFGATKLMSARDYRILRGVGARRI